MKIIKVIFVCVALFGIFSLGKYVSQLQNKPSNVAQTLAPTPTESSKSVALNGYLKSDNKGGYFLQVDSGSNDVQLVISDPGYLKQAPNIVDRHITIVGSFKTSTDNKSIFDVGLISFL